MTRGTVVGRVSRGAAGALFVLFAVVSSSGRARADEPARWDYVIDVAADLSRLDVHLSFSNFTPRRLALAGGGSLTAIRLREIGGARLERQDAVGAVRVDALDARGGLDYSVDLKALEPGRDGATRAGDDLVTRTGALLLRPLVVPEDATFTASVRTPPGVRFAVPWPVERTAVDASGATTTHHRFDRSAWSMVGNAALGRFASETLSIAGATFDLVTLSRPHAATAEGIRRWIRAAVEGIALLYGRFPVPRVSIFVLPVPGRRDDPVSFGSTWYGGGPHVLLYLAEVARDEDLVGEWVAIHELLHATMPSMVVEDAWLSEGFVTYYQEVLRGRAGFQPPASSWQLLEEGFGRGRSTGTGATLAVESAGMRSNHTYWRVYWSGAAIALKVDLELRRASGGKRSLDDVMRHWARRTGNVTDVTAADLVADADRFLGAPVLASIATPLLGRSEFPDVAPCYRWLGLVVEDGRVSAVPAEGAAERDRIVRPPPPPPPPLGVPSPAASPVPAVGPGR